MMFKLIAVLLLSFPLSAIHFEAYLTKQISETIPAQTTINLKCFPFSFEGIGEDLHRVVQAAKDSGRKIKIVFGGAYNPLSPYLQNAYEADYLAYRIAKVVGEYGFDGVDLAIFDATVDAELEIRFIKALKELLGNDKILALTLPPQGWYPPFATVVAGTAKVVSYFNFMEFDMWIDPHLTYPQQVESDVGHILHHFALPKEQIQLGLSGDAMGVEWAQALADFALKMGLRGVTLWDAEEEKLIRPQVQALLTALFPPPPPPVVLEEKPPAPPLKEEPQEEDFFAEEPKEEDPLLEDI